MGLKRLIEQFLGVLISFGFVTSEKIMSGIIFCPDCNNMLYPKEDKLYKKLNYACRQCPYQERARNPCIYVSNISPDQNELARMNADLIFDPTIPRETKKCPGANCDSSNVIYLQSNVNDPKSKMNLYFICRKCKLKWTY